MKIRLGRARIVAGLISIFIISAIVSGNLHGRLNFKFEEVEIGFKNLPDNLDGLRIVQLSDLHLGSFRKDKEKLIDLYDSIDKLRADILVNTGDFVSYSYKEMDQFQGVLATANARYGKFTSPGNHDTGIYNKEYKNNTEEHLVHIRNLVEGEGFTWLSDSSVTININSTILKIAGTSISGRIPDIKSGDTDKALSATGDCDFTILLSHDPDHWIHDVQFRNIDLTLSGHTHGMQMGILTPWFNISPARIIFKAWYGLYQNNGNILYVSRGLGTMGPPIRIGMPPEISIITLRKIR